MLMHTKKSCLALFRELFTFLGVFDCDDMRPNSWLFVRLAAQSYPSLAPRATAVPIWLPLYPVGWRKQLLVSLPLVDLWWLRSAPMFVCGRSKGEMGSYLSLASVLENHAGIPPQICFFFLALCLVSFFWWQWWVQLLTGSPLLPFSPSFEKTETRTEWKKCLASCVFLFQKSWNTGKWKFGPSALHLMSVLWFHCRPDATLECSSTNCTARDRITNVILCLTWAQVIFVVCPISFGEFFYSLLY